MKTTSSVVDFLSDETRDLINRDMESIAQDSFPVNPGQFKVFNMAQYIESKTIVPGYTLSSQGDSMLMANSVEERYPFLDHRVIEFAQKLKNRFNLNGLYEKFILKEVVKNRIPKSVINRPKQPYRAPDINALMCSKDDRLMDYLAESEIRKYGLFENKKVQMLLKKARVGRAQSVKDNMLFTIILSIQIWVQKFLTT